MGHLEARGRRLRGLVRLLLPPLVAQLTAAVLLFAAAYAAGANPWAAADWSRWDSGHYLTIAERGYVANPCGPGGVPPGAPPGPHLCGNITWFPLYPRLLRGVTTATPLAPKPAGVLLAWTAWYLVLTLVWTLARRDGRPVTALGCLALAAVFPGHVYYAALYPISLEVLCLLGCLALVARRPRPLAAAVTAAGAGGAYISGVLLAPILGLWGLAGMAARRLSAARATAAAAGILGALAGFAGVLALMWGQVGRFDAYFAGQRKYGAGVHFPLGALTRRLAPLWDAAAPYPPTVTARQTVVLLAVVAAALAGGLWAVPQRRATALDSLLLVAVPALVVFPYLAGGNVAVYRSEALVVPAVLLLRRLPAAVPLLLAAVAAAVGYDVDVLFFRNVLH